MWDLLLSFTFTDEQYVVVAESHGAFTSEAPNLVDTHSMGADTWDLSALINVYTKQYQRAFKIMHKNNAFNMNNNVMFSIYHIYVMNQHIRHLDWCQSPCNHLTNWLASVDVNDEARSLVTTQ